MQVVGYVFSARRHTNFGKKSLPKLSIRTGIYYQAQPKQKPYHSWAVLVLNPTSPARPATRPAVRKSTKLVLLSQACKTKVISLYE